LAAIFSGLEPPGLCYLLRFPCERPGYASQKSGRPTSISRHRMGPVSGSLQDLLLILLPSGGCCDEKWHLHWINGQATSQHTPTSTI
jgi:hypothetical protein